jgi:hypothetical protein
MVTNGGLGEAGHYRFLSVPALSSGSREDCSGMRSVSYLGGK